MPVNAEFLRLNPDPAKYNLQTMSLADLVTAYEVRYKAMDDANDPGCNGGGAYVCGRNCPLCTEMATLIRVRGGKANYGKASVA